MTLAIVIVYALVACMTVRPLAGHLAWQRAKRYKQKEPDNGDWSDAWFSASFGALAWPLVLLVAAGGKYGPKFGAEKEALYEQQKQRIAELEREVDDEWRARGLDGKYGSDGI